MVDNRCPKCNRPVDGTDREILNRVPFRPVVACRACQIPVELHATHGELTSHAYCSRDTRQERKARPV